MYEAIEHFTDIDISKMEESELFETAKKLKADVIEHQKLTWDILE